jgi:hypothetical protein
MTKESIVELQKIDSNCNDCIHMNRDIAKYESFNSRYRGTNPSHRILYGHCSLKNIEVSFIANTCQIHTQSCFKHRRD